MITKASVLIITIFLTIPASGWIIESKLGFLKPYYMAYSFKWGEKHIGYYNDLKTCLEDKVFYAKEAKKKYKTAKVVCKETLIGGWIKSRTNNDKSNTAREGTTMDK